jgi:ribosomal protein L11 methyltransferase
MSKSSKVVVRKTKTWGWRRWTSPDEQDFWIERLQAANIASWVFTERPGRKRILLEAYLTSRAAAVALNRQWGGRVYSVDVGKWIKSRPASSTRIGSSLEIIHQKPRSQKESAGRQLHIPHGIAFGSGEHATTSMLLRALVCHGDWAGSSVLDLGTGSGVLALTARLLGARKIVATDFDPDAVRTARQNEALNFSKPLVRWRCADVKKLRAGARYDLVLANLFSGILGEAAPRIAGCVTPGGQLWLSGILRFQQAEVIAAYRGLGLQLFRAVSRGKWIMLQWARN